MNGRGRPQGRPRQTYLPTLNDDEDQLRMGATWILPLIDELMA